MVRQSLGHRDMQMRRATDDRRVESVGQGAVQIGISFLDRIIHRDFFTDRLAGIAQTRWLPGRYSGNIEDAARRLSRRL